MKLTLRKLMFAGVAALMSFGASAQTLEKVWSYTDGNLGSTGETRFGAALAGKLIVSDKTGDAQKISYWDATNQGATLHDLAGTAIGTGINVDEAGNIIVNTGFPNAASSTDFVIVATDGTVTPLTIALPSGDGARFDQLGRIVGDVMSEEGAYMFVCKSGVAVIDVIKIENGAQNEDYSITIDSPVTNNTSTVVQPAPGITVEDITMMIDAEYETDASVPVLYVRQRGSSNNVFVCNYLPSDSGSNFTNATITLSSNDATATTAGASNEGFDVFALQGKTYFVCPITTTGDTGERGTRFAIFGEDGALVAATPAEENVAGSATVGSIAVEPCCENEANIYRFLPAAGAAKYTFTVGEHTGDAPGAAAFELVSMTPADGETVSSCDHIVLTFSKDVASVDYFYTPLYGPGFSPMYNSWDIEFDGPNVIIYPLDDTNTRVNLEANEWEMNGMAGFTAADGSVWEGYTKLFFTVAAPALELVETNPEDGAVLTETPPYFAFTFSSVISSVNSEVTATIMNVAGETFSAVVMRGRDFSGTTAWVVPGTLDEPITLPAGQYMLVIPEGIITAENGAANEEIEYFFSIEAAGPANVILDPDPATPVTSIKQISVTNEGGIDMNWSYSEYGLYNEAGEKIASTSCDPELYIPEEEYDNYSYVPTTVIFTFDEITTPGTYVFKVERGFLENPMTWSPIGEVVATYTINEGGQVTPPVDFPEDVVDYPDFVFYPGQKGTVNKLSQICLSRADGGTMLTVNWSYSFPVINYATGEEVAMTEMSGTYTNQLEFNLDNELTEAGIYTFTIPAGTLMYPGWNAYETDLVLYFRVDPNYVPNLGKLYLVGAHNGWVEPIEANAAAFENYTLLETREGSNIYEGTFDIAADCAQFRFYAELAGFDASKQYGYATYDWDTDIITPGENKAYDVFLSYDNYSGYAAEGSQGQWMFPVWNGNKMFVRVNLLSKQVDVKAVEYAEVDFPELYVRGEFGGDNWDAMDAYKLKLTDVLPGEQGYYDYTAIVPAFSGKFKIADANWNVDFGAGENATVVSTAETEAYFKGGDFNFTAAGDDEVMVKFRYNPNTKKASKLVMYDVVPVKVVSTTPANGATVAPLSIINVEFDQEIISAIYEVGESYDPENGVMTYQDWNVVITDSKGNTNNPNDPTAPIEVYMYADFQNPKAAMIYVSREGGLLTPETYTVKIKAGAITSALGTVNDADIDFSFTVRPRLETTVTPASGSVVESLCEIAFDNADGIMASGMGSTLYKDGEVYLTELFGMTYHYDEATGKYVEHLWTDSDAPTRVLYTMVTYDSNDEPTIVTITEPGVYTLDVQYAFIDLNYNSVEVENPTWTIEAPATPAEFADYVYDVKLNDKGNGQYTVYFRSTGDAAAATLKLFADGKETVEVPMGAIVAGDNQFDYDASNLGVDVEYNFSIVVDNASDAEAAAQVFAGTSFAETTRGGMVVINDTESDAFGYAVVAAGKAQGIQLYEPNHNLVGTFHAGEDQFTATNQSSPFRGAEREGKAVFGDYSDKGANYYVFDPLNPEAELGRMLGAPATVDGDGMWTLDGAPIGGGNSGHAFRGKGEATQMFTVIEDFTDHANTLARYDIGTAETILVAPAFWYTEANKQLPNHNVQIAIGEKGMFIAQIRSNAEEGTVPRMVYLDYENDKVIASWWNDEIPTSVGAVALNKEENLLAVGTEAGVQIYEVAISDANVPTLTFKYLIEHAFGGFGEFAFDVAGNLHAYSRGAKGYVIFALPESKVAETAAKAEFVVKGASSGVEDILLGGEDAVYYNIQGVQIPADELVPGVYVKVVGDKATKVVVK